MLYDISLKVMYRYGGPVRTGRHLVHLWPLSLPGIQSVGETRVDITPEPADRSGFKDFFGNWASEIVFDTPHQRFEVKLSTRVERHLITSPRPASIAFDKLAEALGETNSLAPNSPLHFLGTTPRVRPNLVLQDYVMDLAPPQASTRDMVRLLGERLNKDMTFDASATSVDTRHEDAFASRRGVCQDFSHIMIAALRSVGVPAGYVSGCLRTEPPPGKERLEGADAMHAWVRAWCGPETGWIEYDPTNACEVSTNHIVIAYGRDYSDVSPVKGVLRSASGQAGSQAVDVVPVREAEGAADHG
ncbi:transglutaminase family protein [Henriciella marina]|uniref:transglutaminase family protein n=1 Tax=Henriciella marina TaxID=453851 RepID=UPI0003618E17|nr:transglutaminase family protein [Henriciella marina]